MAKRKHTKALAPHSESHAAAHRHGPQAHEHHQRRMGVPNTHDPYQHGHGGHRRMGVPNAADPFQHGHQGHEGHGRRMGKPAGVYTPEGWQHFFIDHQGGQMVGRRLGAVTKDSIMRPRNRRERGRIIFFVGNNDRIPKGR